MKFISLFIVLISFLSCSEETFSPEELYTRIREGDPTVKAVMAKSLDQPLVYCKDYDPPCENAFVVQVKGMNVLFLNYQNQQQAFKAAVHMKGYVARNWAIDDVTGEPILESFMMKYLGARKAH